MKRRSGWRWIREKMQINSRKGSRNQTSVVRAKENYWSNQAKGGKNEKTRRKKQKMRRFMKSILLQECRLLIFQICMKDLMMPRRKPWEIWDLKGFFHFEISKTHDKFAAWLLDRLYPYPAHLCLPEKKEMYMTIWMYIWLLDYQLEAEMYVKFETSVVMKTLNWFYVT